VLDITTHKRKDEDKQNKKSQHNMCWTPPHIREKTKTNKTKNTTQYVLDDNHAQDKRRRQTKQKNNTICVGRLHAEDKRRR
jgi:hypothetical protein